MGSEKIQSFKDLVAWKKGHILVLLIYQATKNFPREEVFGIVSQIRRSAVSITSNIAEGFARNSKKEKVQFYSIAQGSLTELQNQLLVAHDVGYLQKNDFEKMDMLATEVQKITNGLIRSCRESSS